ncbi:hypothetical protein VMCG_09939 [Cytospora schulzeri]|uniref:BRCT domain-containing protein n=1 Tax=Cytospora schulzeri TaxID=448051 RepID=A0A423VFA1_9PEZI|nr:hypothetical protein VMCG_09939 [Valsa malicola]
MGPKVLKGQTLIEAEKRALSGDVESQDSQFFLERYHQKYAPGLRSSSPSEPLPPEAVENQLHQYTRPTKVHQKFAGVTTSAQSSSNSTSKPNGRARTEAKVNPRRGRSVINNPTKVKGDTCSGDQQAAGAAGAIERSGGARTKAAPNASTSQNQRASSYQSPRHPSEQATLNEATKCPESALEPEADIDRKAIDGTYLRHNPHGPVGTVDPSLLISTSFDDDDGGNGRNPGPPTQVTASSTIRKKPQAGLSKMEISQSPTQSNDGRSYEQYLPRGDDLIPTEPPEELEPLSQHSEHASGIQDENRSLHEDDTGAVNFDNLNQYDTGTDFTAPDSIGTGIPSHGLPSQFTAYPETPAPHKNPFAGTKAHLLGSSQMFKQTQMSSACKAFSPTSSRPSPDNLQLQGLISPNVNISSPLKNFVGPSPFRGGLSSPQLPPPYETSPQQASYEQPVSDEDVADPTPLRPTRKLPTGLMESYTPMHRSQDRLEVSPHLDFDTDSDEDADYDGVERRRHLAMLKKMAAEKQLRSINIERQSATEDVVVPSTNRRKQKNRKTDPQRYVAQCEGRAGEETQDAVEDSQDAYVDPAAGHIDNEQAVIGDSQAGDPVVLPEHATHVSSNEGLVSDTLPNTARSPSVSPLPAEEDTAPNPRNGSKRTRQEDADAIPETSPARLRPLGEMLPHSSDEVLKPESFSNLLGSSFRDDSLDRGNRLNPLPTDIRSSASSQAQRPNTRSQRDTRGPEEATVSHDKSEDTLPDNAAHSETVEVAHAGQVINSSPPGPAPSTKSRLRSKRGHGQSTTSEGPSSSVSTLSVLTTTPEISNKTTPLTQESPANTDKSMPSSSNVPQTSPTVAKANRRGSTGTAPNIKPALTPRKSFRTSTRRSSRSFPRQASVSTDELARSPFSSAPRTFEQSAMLSRLSRTSLREAPGSRESSRGGGTGIFTGMAFAISFQPKLPGEKDSQYNSRLGLSNKIADKIKQAGGKVLTSGFDELFEVAAIKNAEVVSSTPPPDDEIKLTTAARNTGFTALIADGHSRKVKYMQALALGLPCIHERWITTCVENQKLVDWSDYLLCAGNSSFLGNAIRSRALPSYDVVSAKLNEVIKHRPRLLDGSRILLVLRRKDEGKKMAYVFLARVLGASLSRVYSMDEARTQLKASEAAGYPYNWVYVEDTMAAKADLFPAGSPSMALAGSKKRKRKSEADLAGPPLKRIRTLSNELVIQSLILGRLLEEDEWNG